MQTIITMDAAGDKLALIHRVPKTGTLTGINFRTGTVSTAGATLRAQVETVTNGAPTGTLKYTNGTGTVVVATSDDNVWKAVAINGGTGVAVTKGDLVATVIDVSSGTPNTVILSTGSTTSMSLGNFPYCSANTTGAYAKLTNALSAPVVWDYGGTFEYCFGMNAADSVAITNIGNTNERALRFQLPAPMRVKGIAAMLCNASAGCDFRVRLYDSTPTLIANAEVEAGADIDGDTFASATIDGYSEFIFPASIELAANTTYYASIYQRTATNLALAEIGVSTAAYMAAMPGGAQLYLATRSGGTGSFANTTTTRPLIWLLVDGIDNAAGNTVMQARRMPAYV